MNIFNHGFSVFVFGLIVSNCMIATSHAAGEILIREKDITIDCSIPAIPGDWHIAEHSTCTNDQAYSVRFLNVPSGLTITFFDNSAHKKCQDGKSWEIAVRTIKNPTTTPADQWISLTTMYSTPDNTLIAPGVLKLRRRDGGPVHGRLTCVRIQDDY